MTAVLNNTPSSSPEKSGTLSSDESGLVGPIAEQPASAAGVEAGGTRPSYDRRGSGAAFLVSFIFHLVLLLALALCVYTAGRPSKGVLLTASVGETLATDFELSSDFSGAPEAASPDMIPEVEEPDVSVDIKISDLLNRLDSSGEATVEATLTSLTGKSIGEGLETRGKGASFFGAYAQGNRFVYVLDSSNSMKGDRWTYACNKLVDSIQGLTPQQEFFVVCFDANTSYLYGVQPQLARFLPADEDAAKRVRRWLRSKNNRLGPSTKPAEALRFAIGLGPDAIFLLSDGELKDQSRDMLKIINGSGQQYRRIPIHTVHLFSARGRATLEGIAQENLGTFTPVNGR